MVTARLLHDVAHGFTGIAEGDLRIQGTGGGPPPSRPLLESARSGEPDGAPDTRPGLRGRGRVLAAPGAAPPPADASSPRSPLKAPDGANRGGVPPVTPTPAATDRLVSRLGGRGPLVMVRQVHGARVVMTAEVRADTEADAIVTTSPGQVVAVRVADCVPVLLAAPGGVAAVHAGWRGTAAGITAASVQALCAATGTHPAQLRAAVGPSICADCYEVGEDVVAGMRGVLPAGLVDEGAWLRTGRGGRPHVDVAAVNVLLLVALGVSVERVAGCSRCGTEVGGAPLYWSHRRDPANGARQVGAIVCP